MTYFIYDDRTYETFYSTDSLKSLVSFIDMLLLENDDPGIDHLRVNVKK